MTATDDILTYRIAFSGYRNIHRSAVAEFRDRGVDEEAFFSLPAAALAARTGVKISVFDDGRRSEALARARAERAFVDKNGIGTIYCSDSDYPSRLGECEDAPAMLYALGDTAILNVRHSVAVVGTRHATPYGLDFTRRLVEDLASATEGLLVVSGLAYGIDIAAHRAALNCGARTAAVFAHGLNTVYPADHRQDARRIVHEGGCLLTEYASVDRMHRGNFLARNRIVAGLADVVIVVESDAKGGAMSTARIAGAYGREVMAAPGRAIDTYSRGCNALIANREASIVRDAADVMELLRWQTRAPEGTQTEIHFDVTDEQRAVLGFIEAHPDATVNDMCAALGMPFARLSDTLFALEMDDMVLSLPGGRYAVVAPAR